jgi:cobalt-zinc-cadmium efflux system protein
MIHTHSHEHHHEVAPNDLNTKFVFGIALNLLFVVVQVSVGLSIHSLSLLSDAGHNFADVGTLAISLLAFRLLKVKSTKQYTYGYRKTSVLTALFNAMVLMVSIGAILYEAAHRFLNPEPMPGMTIAIVAAVGVLINAASAFLFFRDKDKDINIKSAYLHLLSDALLSLAIVVGGVVIYYTHWFWVDSVMSVVVAIIILFSTWSLLRDSVRLSLDGVPHSIDLDDVRKTALVRKGIRDFHHIHIWAISTTENALTAHVVLETDIDHEQQKKIIRELKHELQHRGIQHITLEIEMENEPCESQPC